MRKKILITGGSGLLGVNWGLEWRSLYDVTLGIHERQVTLPSVKSKVLDLTAFDTAETGILACKPDIIIHCVALTSVEMCERDPKLANTINVDLARNVALVCEKWGVKLVYISTDHLFSGEQEYIKEDSAYTPLNQYGSSKAVAEQQVLSACTQALVIRTNFFGWGLPYRKSFSDGILEELRAGRSLRLFDDVFFSPILIEALIFAVQKLLISHEKGIFNLVGDERISKYHFGLLLADEFELDAKLIQTGHIAECPHLVVRPRDMSLCNQKATAVLGYRLGSVSAHLARLREQELAGLPVRLSEIT